MDYNYYDDIPLKVSIYRKADKYFTHRVLFYDENDKYSSFLIEIDFAGNYSKPIIYEYSDALEKQKKKSEIEVFYQNTTGWNRIGEGYEPISPDILSNLLILVNNVKKK